MLTRYSLRTLLAALLSTSLLAGGASAQDPLDEPPLSLRLEADAPLTGVASLADLQVTFENVGDGGLSVILPVDGSFDGMRSPGYRWIVFGPGGDELVSHPRPRCGMVNPLLPDDVVFLEPGETADVTRGWMAGPDAFYELDGPGTYRIRLVYETDPSDTMWGDRAVTPGGSAMLADVWSGQVVSNEIELSIGLGELHRLPWNGPVLTELGPPIRLERVAVPLVVPDAPDTLQ